MPPSIGNSGRVTLTGLQLPSLAPNLAHFLATESGTSPADPRQAADRHCHLDRTYLPPQAPPRGPRPPHLHRVPDDHDPTGPPSPVTRTVTGSCSRPPPPSATVPSTCPSFQKRPAFETVIAPREIFNALPGRSRKPEYLRDSQGSVLDAWFKRRTERDLVIKINTGGGKTVAGLLVLQSCLNEHQGPALYVAPDNYLVDQVRAKRWTSAYRRWMIPRILTTSVVSASPL